jgi:hypothetical protein
MFFAERCTLCARITPSVTNHLFNCAYGTSNRASSAIRKHYCLQASQNSSAGSTLPSQIYEVCKKAALCFGWPVLCTAP